MKLASSDRGVCVFRALGGDREASMRVRVSLDARDEMALYTIESKDDKDKDTIAVVAVPLAHAPHCPMLHVDRASLPDALRPPSFAVCVILRDAESGAVLLTRRPAQMRSFPKAWVFPGGKVDPGETVLEAGARELVEETDIEADPASLAPLAVWESVYPTRVQLGQPLRHYIVIYCEARVRGLDVRAKLKVSEREVDKTLWIDPSELLHRRVRGDDVADELHGIYPNTSGSGLARGHVFALEALLQET